MLRQLTFYESGCDKLLIGFSIHGTIKHLMECIINYIMQEVVPWKIKKQFLHKLLVNIDRYMAKDLTMHVGNTLCLTNSNFNRSPGVGVSWFSVVLRLDMLEQCNDSANNSQIFNLSSPSAFFSVS